MTVDPAALKVLAYPAAVLRGRAGPVAEITPEVRAVAARMIELMRLEEGIGLAAPQVGLPWRMFVVDLPPLPAEGRSVESDPPTATNGPQIHINPRFTALTGPTVAAEEGCLSLPDIRGDVLRPPVATLVSLNLQGRESTRTAGGLLARCWQHEMDHLDGVLIIDKFTQMSRLKNRAAVRDLERAKNEPRAK